MSIDEATGLVISKLPVGGTIAGGIAQTGPIANVLQNDDLQANIESLEDEDEEQNQPAAQQKFYAFEIDVTMVEVCGDDHTHTHTQVH